ncbi:Crp/Fnr family transcriptional regulator [Hymenobacter sp. YC55]|uniref:Crp/Fnr family transcriptional regulator n=1 Tax=Hymenobacter sp. YC55 TaxID=3034019 RepID=UPI0023F73B48|nr:Crp/Fnr family transcriptional regulator [Hymenobacter sp. YC55]MDF7814937.1 Crp/Fnr family transcriptional regulator [Hymenobacter sp. YC55]
MTPHESLLAVVRRFVTLTPAEEILLTELFVAEQLPKGGFFLRPGQVSRKVAFIVEGVFHNFRHRDGQEHSFYFGREREFIGDYSSFLPAQPAAHGIQALEPARLLSISYDNLQRLYREVGQGERFGRLVAETLFTDVLGQLTSFYEETPEERYARFVRTYPDLQQRVPQYYIASYVGVKPQSLSRIRGRTGS